MSDKKYYFPPVDDTIELIEGTPIVNPKPRGFAALSPEQRKLVAAAGGRSVPAHKRAFSLDSNLASSAGTKGGANGRGGGRPRKDSEDE